MVQIKFVVYNDDLGDDNSDYVNDEDAEEDLDEEEQDDEGCNLFSFFKILVFLSKT